METLTGSRFELLVYLIPGFAVTLGVLLVTAPKRLALPEDKLGLGHALLAAGAALLIGVVLLRISSTVPWALGKIYGEPVLTGIIRSFPDSLSFREKISSEFPKRDTTILNQYFLAKAVVEQRATNSGDEARRLQGMALLSRSLCLALPFLLACSAWRVRRGGRRHQLIVLAALALTVGVTGVLFLKSYLAYSSAAARAILRAYVVLPQ